MNLRRAPFYVLAALFALALNAYVLFNEVMQKAHSNGKLSLTNTNECDDPSQNNAPAENPNKLLFVSCGGFEE